MESKEIPITEHTVINILSAPPIATIITPKLAPAIICQAPVNPEPVPAYLPAEDMAPIVAFEIKIPLPNPNNPHGSAIVIGLRFKVIVENNKINIEKSVIKEPENATTSMPRITRYRRFMKFPIKKPIGIIENQTPNARADWPKAS